MKYTATFAHLSSIAVKEGDLLERGELIGVMGNTGDSDGIHLHLDVVEGDHHSRTFTLRQIATGSPKACEKQLNYFLDSDLLKSRIKVTTQYMCPDYERRYKRPHPGYDLINADGLATHRSIYWNRSFTGRVRFAGYNKWYGNHVMVMYDTL